MTPASRNAPRLPPEGQRRPLLVKKFGGTSVATIGRMREVARLSCESHRAGNDVVVVVSAMSGETDRLLALAGQVLPRPDAREQDVVVATGEQVSCALVAMAIQALGGKACSLLGYQVPLLTDGSFGKARIECVGQARIRLLLSQGQIPVVAGFQGVDAGRDVTTLGRGGSDTTAVALAAALSADACEIYTDVAGIFTADPRVSPFSRKLAWIAYDEMMELASMGARVLQLRSVEIAMKHGISLHVRSTFTAEEGTWVTARDPAIEARAMTGIACARGQVQVVLAGTPARPGALAELTSLLADLNVCADMLAFATVDGEHADITFTLAAPEVDRARQPLERLATALGCREVLASGRMSKVSLIGIGVRSDPRITAHACRSLAEHDIEVLGLAMNEIRMSCLVDEASADEAVRVLHDAFGLSQDGAASVRP